MDIFRSRLRGVGALGNGSCARRAARAFVGGLLTIGVCGGALSSGIAVASAAPSGGPYYVDVSGSGTACSQSSPCASISQAVATAGSGATATIEVGAGSFADHVTIPAGKFTIAGIPGSTALVPPSGGSGDTAFTNNSGTLNLSGMSISGFNTGVATANVGTTRIDDVQFSAETAAVVNSTTTTVVDSSVSGATTAMLGEGTSSSSLSVESSTVASSGANGIIALTGSLSVTDSTISDNGLNGIYVNGGTASVSSSTIADNGAYGIEDNTSTTAFGTILADNGTNSCSSSAEMTDNGYNIDSGNSCGLESYSPSFVDSDPGLGALQNNGGPTETQAILPTSSAYHVIPGPSCLSTDQRGESRPQPATSLYCDIGAFEYSAPTSISVTSAAVTGPTSSGANLGPVVVGAFDADGYPAISTNSIVLNLSTSASDAAFSLTEGGASTSEVVIPSGATTGSFYTGDVHPTSLPVEISASGLGNASQTETVVTGPAASVTPTSGDNQSAPATTTFTNSLSVEVEDGTGNPVDSEPITFTVTSGSANFSGNSSTLVHTNTSGVASATLTAGETAGPVVIGVTSSQPSAHTTFDETVVPGPPSSITISTGNNQSSTPYGDFPEPLTAIVKDAYGNDIEGQQVDFAVTGGSASFPSSSSTSDDSTNSSGFAEAQVLTAGPTAGPVTTTATVDGTGISTTFTGQVVTPGREADFNMVSGDGSSVTPTEAFATPTVKITDAEGNPISGVAVNFSISGPGSFPSGDVATTGSNGEVSVPVDADTATGAVQVTASTASFSDITFDDHVVPGPAYSITVESGGGQTMTPTADFADALSVLVQDAWGNVIPGDQVDFAVTGGSASLGGSPTDEEITNSSGIATALPLVAGDTAGPVGVSAAVDSTSVSTSFSGLQVLPGPASDFTITGGNNQSTTPTEAFGSDLAVLITDAWGNPIAGDTVTFAVATGSASVSSGGIESTDSNGNAEVPLDAGTAAGPVTVTASASSLSTLTFDETVDPGPATSISVVSGNNKSVQPYTAFPVLKALVVDDWGNPIEGDQVDFAVTSGSATFPSSSSADDELTDSNGHATAATLTSGPTAGPVTVTATIDSTSITTSYSETVVPGPAADFNDTAGDDQSVTPTASFTDSPSVQITDAEGNPISGVTVTFTDTEGSVTFPSGDTAVTDSNGDASVPLDAGTVAGPVVVTASALSLSDLAFDETVDPGPATAINVVSGNDEIVQPNTAFPAIEAQVLDNWGNPIEGDRVDFAVASGSASFPSSSSTDDETTDSNGNATAATLTSGPTAGPVSVTATVDSTSVTTTYSETVIHGPASIFSDTAGNDQSATPTAAFADNPSVQITDAEGNPVSGVTVTFAATEGSVTFPSGDTAVTDSNGDASVPVSAGTTAGPVVITASAPSLSTLTFDETVDPGPATTISVTNGNDQEATPYAAFSDPLQALVQDAWGNPIEGAQVDFAVTGGSADLAGSSATTSSLTDDTGTASATLTAGAAAGPVSTTATVDGLGITTSYSDQVVVHGPASDFTATAGDNQTATPGEAFGTAPTVTITDAEGNPISGAAVNFAVTSGSATLPSGGSATTDSDGVASVPLTAGDSAGAVVVTASSSGLTDVTFNETVVHGPAAHLATTGNRQVAYGDSAFAELLTGTVTDAEANVISGATVLFKLSGPAAFAGGAKSASEATNGSGTATAPMLISTGVPGTVTVTVSSSGTSPSTLTEQVERAGGGATMVASTPDGKGRWVVTAEGVVHAYGNAVNYGSVKRKLNGPVVGITPTPSGKGYWLVASDGGVFSFGDAVFHGSEGSKHLASPVVGLAVAPNGKGYWLADAAGQVFPFGDVKALKAGSSKKITEPVVGIETSPDGSGYWLVTSTGQVYPYGDAKTFAANSSRKITSPVVGMAITPSGQGYWLATSSGAVYSFGNAHLYHEVGSKKITAPIVGIAGTPDGRGYYLVTGNDVTYAYGDAG